MSDDDAEFTHFVRRHSPALLRTAFHLTADPARADDLLRTALTATYLQWSRTEDPVASTRHALAGAAAPWWRPSSWRGDEPDGDDVIEAFRALPARQRAVAALRYLEELSEVETADLLGLPVAVVRAETKRGLPVTRLTEAMAENMAAAADGLAPGPELAAQVIARGQRARRRRRGVAAVVVSLVVAAAVAMPRVLVDTGGPEAVEPPPTTAAPTLDPLPWGPPPRVPYTITDPRTGAVILYDGSARVPLPGGVTVVGRVPGGWFVQRPQNGPVRRTEAGVLDRRGAFRLFGQTRSDSPAALSPDGTRAAFAADDPGVRRVVLADVRTAARTGALPIADADVVGWNAHGVWLRSATGRTRVWRPGAAPVEVPGAETVRITRTTPHMLDLEGCTAVVTLTPDDRLRRLRRDCLDETHGSTLSPNGEAVLLPDGSVPRLSDRRTTQIRPPGNTGWEDADHVLLWEAETDDGTTRETVVRCDIRTAACERAYDTERPGTGTRLVLWPR
ncbi:MAG TPA: sigma factor-like helix-turn-helix DNA-binding protein [Kribbellaceae bacterium]|nr:sigma factor-like helix-turn-helix DNA-binding protein [Kribbellaceae bacterium]